MAKLTDVFIEKPVLAVVISLLILLVGLRALFSLPLRQFPKIDNTIITITTIYPGASADLVQGFITTPLEKRIAAAEGLDYMTSTSNDGVSQITVYLKLNFNPDTGFTSVLSKVQEAQQELPQEAEQPILRMRSGTGFAIMYIGFQSEKMEIAQTTDYLSRVVQPKLQTLDGVAQARILSSRTYAMRIWLNTRKMAGLGVTASEVFAALRTKNVQAAAGKTKGKFVQINIKPNTDLSTPEEFDQIIIKRGTGGALIRLKDVAKAELGSENYDTRVNFSGKNSVFIGITATPRANPLAVINRVRAELKTLNTQFPKGLQAKVAYDVTKYIRSSIREVMKTILEATIIVVIVIYLFLGSIRTMVIPVVAIPLSLIGVGTFMLMLGYSINLLTLLAMVLAIGMVVDDAIVVVENIFRHIEQGKSAFAAAKAGAGEILMPIVAMTLTLAAVYAPIGFTTGLTGALFKQFAFTLAGAVVISGVIAITLSPMMCSKVLTRNIEKQKFVCLLEDYFDRLKSFYTMTLTKVISYKPTMVFFAFVVLTSCVFLYANSKKELAPLEDRGFVFISVLGPRTATLDYMRLFTDRFAKIYDKLEAKEDYFIINSPTGNAGTSDPSVAISGLIMKPWSERSMQQSGALRYLQQEFNKIPGLQIQAIPLPPIPVGGVGVPIQFQVVSTRDIKNIYPVAQALIARAYQSGLFLFLATRTKIDKPELQVKINRNKAAELGIGIDTIANALATAYGENHVNWFNMENRNYKVIPQVAQKHRLRPSNVKDLYVVTQSGKYVPLSTVATFDYKIKPNSLTRFQQLNSIELIGTMRAGITLGQGLDFLRQQAIQLFPQGVSYDFAGTSRQFVQEGTDLMYIFFFAICIIYLVLAALFESFRDPLVILISVPMAICGALIATNLGIGATTINIYTQIGMITLIGLISKHGILMVDFANHIKQNESISASAAIVKAAGIRLRPILMTTFSMIFGVVPLILASGAGANSRFHIGLMIAMGMAIGTLFTLYVLPTIYTLTTRAILLFLVSVTLFSSLLYWIIF